MTILGANVTLIEHSIVYGETLEDYTIQVDYALPLTYRAAQVPKLGDAYPGDTAPWGYLVISHESFKTMERGGGNLRERYDLKLIDTRTVALGPYVTRVTYAKPKVPYDSGIAALKEVYRRFETGRRQSLNIPRYYGTRVFLVADADAENVVNAALPDRTPMVAAGSWSAALLREKIITRNWRVGIARVEALYDSTSRMGEVLAIGQGILEARAEADWMGGKVNLKVGTRTVGEEFVSGGIRQRWTIIKGTGKWPLVKATLVIRVLLTQSNLNALAPLVGKVNDATCSNIINAAKDTLWFKGLTLRQREWGQSNLYDCAIYLYYDPEGWDAETVAQLQKWVCREQHIYTDDEAALTTTGRKVPTWTWVDAGSGLEELMPDIEDDFGVINGYLA